MNEDGFLTVTEFSNQAGVSKQAVYQRLNSTLKDFVKEKDGIKLVDIRALDLFNNKDMTSLDKQIVRLHKASNQLEDDAKTINNRIQDLIKLKNSNDLEALNELKSLTTAIETLSNYIHGRLEHSPENDLKAILSDLSEEQVKTHDELKRFLETIYLAKNGEIERLEKQLIAKDEQIKDLNERLKESHVLVKTNGPIEHKSFWQRITGK